MSDQRVPPQPSHQGASWGGNSPSRARKGDGKWGALLIHLDAPRALGLLPRGACGGEEGATASPTELCTFCAGMSPVGKASHFD